MFTIEIALPDSSQLLILKTSQRSRARAVKLVCLENKLECKVSVEVAAREVKFKGL